MEVRSGGDRGQLAMWEAWHGRHVALDDSPLHTACRTELIGALPPPDVSGPILELGSGQGYDAIAIAENGYQVEALEFSEAAITIARRNLSCHHGLHVSFARRNISFPLPYADSYFSGIYSYLALHYFDLKVTKEVFSEIARVAKRECAFSFAVRSIEDPLFGKGEKIGTHFYDLNGHVRHFFDVNEVAGLLQGSWVIHDLRASRDYYLSRSQKLGGIIKGMAIRI